LDAPVVIHPGDPILLATRNPAKADALRGLLEGLPLHPLTPEEAGLDLPETEEGENHGSVALAKAVSASRLFGGLALASDGGLVVPALGEGWRSLLTRRFAGPGATDEERARALLERMRGLTGEARRAYWVEAVALAWEGRPLGVWEAQGGEGGVIGEGWDPSRPLSPFWVWRLWYFPALGKTREEMTPQERERVGDPWTRLRPPVQEFLGRLLAGGWGGWVS